MDADGSNYTDVGIVSVRIDEDQETAFEGQPNVPRTLADARTTEIPRRLAPATSAWHLRVGVPRVGVTANPASTRNGHRVILTTLELATSKKR